MILEGVAIVALIGAEAVLGFVFADGLGRALTGGEDEDRTVAEVKVELEGRTYRAMAELKRDGTPQHAALWKNERGGLSRMSPAELGVIVNGERLLEAITEQGLDAEDTKVYSVNAAHKARALREEVEDSRFRDVVVVQEEE